MYNKAGGGKRDYGYEFLGVLPAGERDVVSSKAGLWPLCEAQEELQCSQRKLQIKFQTYPWVLFVIESPLLESSVHSTDLDWLRPVTNLDSLGQDTTVLRVRAKVGSGGI